MRMQIYTLGLVCTLVTFGAHSAELNQTVQSFQQAKKLIYSHVFHDHRETLYCGVPYSTDRVPQLPAGLTTESYQSRHHRIEMEHIVASSEFGRQFGEYREGHPKCVSSKGKAYKGRKCAEKTNPDFRLLHADAHNLYPAIGSVNATRRDYRFSEIAKSGTVRFGSCDFKVSDDRKVEPPARAKGIVARAHLYFDLYPQFKLSRSQRQLFTAWDNTYPATSFECTRNNRIAAFQGNTNPFVDRWCR